MMDTNRSKSFGLWIIPEILHNSELSVQEKLLLAQIFSLHENNGCFASNSFFSRILNVQKNRISKIISKLIAKDFVSSIYYQEKGNKRVLVPNYDQLVKKTGCIGEKDNTLTTVSPIGVVNGTNHNNNLFITNKNLKNHEEFKKFKKNENSKYNKKNKNRFDFDSEPDYETGL